LDNENKNPDEWFSQLEIIQAELQIDFQHIVSAKEMISHIIFNVKPQRYQTLKRELKNAPNTLDLEMVEKDIRQLYIQSRKGDTKKQNELVLSAQEKKKKTFKKVFKGDCRICGRKDADCWESDKNKDTRPSNYKPQDRGKDPKSDLKCAYCQKTGHLAEHCFAKKRDDKKKNSNNANFMMIAIDGNEGEDFHKEMNLMHKEGRDSRHLKEKYR
jgi:hypothetical protein